ncbi:MAG: hypothetical protein WB783_05245 [Arenicellales bacterium]|jgi:3-hydroxymyristoyl/3-hydroxydecanoyl-(acyl carrier protein) dehydratase
MNDATHWIVPPDHSAFAGHFPGIPILPGAVLLDVALQAIAEATGTALDICDVLSVKFLSPASPGDELTIRHTLSGSGTIRFDIATGTRKIASGSIAPLSPE